MINTELVGKKLCTIKKCMFQLLNSDQRSGTHRLASNVLMNLLQTMDLYREHLKTIAASIPSTSPLIKALKTLEAQLEEVIELKGFVQETVRHTEARPPGLGNPPSVQAVVRFIRNMRKGMTVTVVPPSLRGRGLVETRYVCTD